MSRLSAPTVLDVTSLISAEDFLLAQNRSAPAEDPFARQCFVEVVQSLLFMADVLVAHPVLLAPRPDDFGLRPRLLDALFRRDVLQPLTLAPARHAAVRAAEQAAVRDLEGVHGVESMARFAGQLAACDRDTAGRQSALAGRIRDWSDFSERRVRSVGGHHTERIQTRDGVENDEFGSWARAATLLLGQTLDAMVGPGRGPYLMATLARSVKYQARAEAVGAAYQCHPLRRDFSLTFDLTRTGAKSEATLDIVRHVRGIHQELRQAAGPSNAHRIRLLELELPLLGGRLWRPEEAGVRDDAAFIDLVADRIAEYRHRTAELRRVLLACESEEDQERLARDIDTVTRHLLERLGLRSVQLSATERELVDSVASVAAAAPGLPKVSGLWFGARTVGKQFSFAGARPFQRFLYREFLAAWKRAGR